MMVESGVPDTVNKMHKERETSIKGILQAIKIDLSNRKRVARAYLSPKSSAKVLKEVVYDMSTNGTGLQRLIGDLNERDPS